MSCESCYNGCVQTVSDECVRYTGLDIPELGISTGDSLKMVEEAITSYLTPLLVGEGDAITLSSGCAIVDGYLPDHLPTTTETFDAVISAICDVQEQVIVIDEILSILNADYDVDCLDGVIDSSNTHDVVQAIITKLCETVTNLEALTLDVETNYVKIADFDALVAAYLAGLPGSGTQNYLKMVPYTVIEYYGSLANFDGTGAGISALGWNKIYLCNGLNGTPDKRGRVGVGAIDGVPGGPLDAEVNPSYAGNPNYASTDTQGANSVTLTTAQIPSHTHTSSASATSTVIDPGHIHYCGNTPNGWSSSGTVGMLANGVKNVPTTSVTTGITVATDVFISNNNTGGGAAHSNIQPVLACYYIMYIP